ncbi:MAG TPA: hypothetical protein VGE27_04515 [Gemmatimonas sp.]|uniref:hypothetical protein n=1 Tax=Gemmatimonas sp. TaxID=1962908 RepID=UPI002ED81898
MRFTTLAGAVGATLALLSSAAPAHAQLGKLKKIGAEAAKKAADEKLTGKKESASPAGGSASESSAAAAAPEAAKAPTISYALTEDHVGMVLAALTPRLEAARNRQALVKARREYAVKDSANKACFDKLSSGGVDPMAMMAASKKNAVAIEKLDTQLSGVQKRLSAASSAQDRRGMHYLQDSLNTIQMRSAALKMGSSCTADFRPAVLIEADIAANGMSGDYDPDRGQFDPTGSVKEKLTTAQFGRIRERMALWALLQQTPGLKVGKDGVFTDEEKTVLAAHAAEIKALTPYFRDNSMRWKDWGDVKNWK